MILDVIDDQAHRPNSGGRCVDAETAVFGRIYSYQWRADIS